MNKSNNLNKPILFILKIILLIGIGFFPLNAQQEESFTISGVIIAETGRGIDGISITFYDGETTTYTTTSEGGHYSHNVYVEWSGTITPHSDCYTFTPPSSTIDTVLSNLEINFNAVQKHYTISGIITDGVPVYSGDIIQNPLSGVVLTLSTGGGTVSNYYGAYTITVNCGWEGTLSAMKVGYEFTPPIFNYYYMEGDLTEQNFVGTASNTSYTISGIVNDEFGRTGMDGVTIEFFDGKDIHTETTAGGGFYSYSVPTNWAGMVTPSLTGFSFTPPYEAVGPVQANITKNFIASASSYNIAGIVMDKNLNPISGVTVKLSNGATVTTGTTGTYSFPLIHDWSGTVTPSKAGWVFEPRKRTYNNLDSDKLNQNFVGYQSSNMITVSGTVKQSNGIGIPGIILEFIPGADSATTDDNGEYSKLVPFNWSGTVTPISDTHIFNPTSRSYNSIKSEQLDQDYIDYTAGAIPEISVNPTQLNFAIDTKGNSSCSQSLLISNSGGGTLNWAITSDKQWINFTPTTGSDSGTVTVSVNATDMEAGSYVGTITITDANAANSPQENKIELTVYKDSEPPFGEFSTPLNNSIVQSSVPFTGWALDDIEVESVKIYLVEKEELHYIGNAKFVEGARPDVELYYPNYPNNSRAGWGYMMLTYFLPNNGNGNYTFKTIATDVEGNETVLGTKTITCDNINAIKPFGAIDLPEQGGVASGNSFKNTGWVLTPNPSKIPDDGSTINVYIDSINLGHPLYNVFRPDIATIFPGYANSNGAHAIFNLDTSTYSNGVHTIYWTATDNNGNTDGIGSRFFTILNTNNTSESTNFSKTSYYFSKFSKELHNSQEIKFHTKSSVPISIKKGFDSANPIQNLHPDNDGSFKINLKSAEPVEIHLGSVLAGFQVVGVNYRSLPTGSTLDMEKGIFYWVPLPTFCGQFHLIFVTQEVNETQCINSIIIDIQKEK